MSMMPLMTRLELPTDLDEIRAIHRAAFGGPLEAALVDGLRSDGLVISSRVALEGERLVGHILFSPVVVEEEAIQERQASRAEVASLAPVAVRPEAQRRGIGSRLIREGIDDCRRRHFHAVVVVGHAGYYPRFGFSADLVRHLRSPFAGDSFMGLELVPGALQRLSGTVRYPAAFGAF
jgi:putative acetyltransferase